MSGPLSPVPAILYTVRATCPSLPVRGRFLAYRKAIGRASPKSRNGGTKAG